MADPPAPPLRTTLPAKTERRRFDHLYVELSVELGELAPRYSLWLALHEAGVDPDTLSVETALAFFDGPLPQILAKHDLALRPRQTRRLRRRLSRFDPAYPTPDETMARLFSSGSRPA